MPGNINFNIDQEEFLKNQRKNVKESKKDYKKKWDRASREEEESALKNYVENEVNLLKLELNIDTDLPEEFKSLNDAGQLMVLRDLKNRVVDIVKSDAQNQYSEYLKEKTETKLGNIGKSLKNAAVGGLKVQGIEKEVFEKIKNDEEGKKLIQENLELLTKITKDKNLHVDGKGNVVIKFIETTGFLSDEESNKADDFNYIANKFRNMPYEWGQTEKKNKILNFFSKEGKNKKAYDEAKAEYDKAREEILNIKSKFKNPKVGEEVVIEMLEIDNAIKMDQVLNTHPEFQVALEQMTEGTNVGKWMKDSISKNFKSYGLTNIALSGVGATARMTAKLAATATAMTGITAIAAPVIGASIGYFKGKFKAKEALRENKKQSRYGKEDESKERANVIDIDVLTKKLDELVKKVNDTTDEKEKAKNLAMLEVRIEHTKGKMEKGEVNFGDAKSALVKQYNMVDTLNQAILLKESNKEEVDTDVKNKINGLLEASSRGLNKTVDEKQDKFIKKQMKKSALIGAGFATAGYLARWAGEELGWWGHAENVEAKPKVDTEEVVKKTKIKTPRLPSFKKVFDGNGVDEKDLNNTKDTIDSADTIKTSIDTTKVAMQTDTLSKDSIFTETKIPTDSTIEKTAEIKDTLKSTVDTTQTTETPAESVKKVAKKAAEKIAKLKNEIESTYPRGAQMDFALTLGKNGVPKNLETAFSEIAADHMLLPEDGIINEEFATKSLNISANLVELTKGHHVAHIDTEEFKNAFSFNEKTGEFEIKDHEKFNGILENLEKHADEEWQNGTLQSKGGAISYISKIKNDSWLKIVHADGMHENVDGEATGIEGHQDVTIDKIKNFTESDMVKKSSIHIETGVGLEHGDKISAEDLMSETEKAARHNATEKEMISAEAKAGNKVTEEDLMSATEKAKHGINTKDLDNTNDVPNSNEYTDNYTLTKEEWYKVGDVNGKNLNKIFNFDLNKYNIIKDNTADDMLSKNVNMEGISPVYKKFLVYIHELQEKTNLEPIHKTLITQPETIDEYITRALGKAQAMKILNKLEL